MKKIATIFITLAILCVGCTKESLTPEPEEVEVSFSFNNILEEGNLATRTSFSDEVLSQLTYKYPEYLHLYCLSGTAAGKSYQINLNTQGNTLSVQKGEYIICSIFESGDNVECWPSTKTEVPLEVKFEERVKTANWSYYGYRINITESKTYTIDVQINCLLLGSKKEETGGIWWRCPDASGQWNDSRGLVTSNFNYTILYIPSKFFKSNVSNNLEIKLGETELSEETIVRTSISRASIGKYLLLSPNAKDIKTFNMNIFNSWEESYE